jgi:hypothetical protein
MKTPFPKKKVSPQELRLMFNGGCFEDRLHSGELHAIVKVEDHPSPPKATQPICTLSQILAYLDANNQMVALVHQFKRRDCSIGGSGLPDPKLILNDGVLYYV